MTRPANRPGELTGSEGSSRRAFIVASLGLLAGCTTTGSRVALPGPAWPDTPEPLEPQPLPRPPSAPTIGGVISRAKWAKGAPVPSLMDPMLPVRYITVHHDGMHPFYAQDERSTATRLERIRAAHRGSGWGDIGYHFIVDRAGRVWEGRPLNWQGAHVKDHNEGNIGVMAVGNFDQQSPSEAQVQALARTVASLMRSAGVPVNRVKTHQEWAVTACPGRALQAYMVKARRTGALA